ncbi:MAG: hypothetical protein WC627_05885 [Legionella sp.]|jgi:hypothetical protein
MIRFFKTAGELMVHAAKIGNPTVGPTLIKLQRPTILSRVDSRTLNELQNSDGFNLRVSESHLRSVTTNCIENYQKYSVKPFGWGACTSVSDAQKFIMGNQQHTDKSWIHIFHGHAVSLSELKIHTGIEGDGFDGENESIVIKHVPFQNIIASTNPVSRDKFFSGMLVVNAMNEFNPKLPKVMKISDLESDGTILRWLMSHDSEEIFAVVCKELFKDYTKEQLTIRFKGEQSLINAIEYSLEASEGTAIKLS